MKLVNTLHMFQKIQFVFLNFTGLTFFLLFFLVSGAKDVIQIGWLTSVYHHVFNMVFLASVHYSQIKSTVSVQLGKQNATQFHSPNIPL